MCVIDQNMRGIPARWSSLSAPPDATDLTRNCKGDHAAEKRHCPASRKSRVADSQNCRCLAEVNIGVDRKHIHRRLQSNVSQVILVLLYPEA